MEETKDEQLWDELIGMLLNAARTSRFCHSCFVLCVHAHELMMSAVQAAAWGAQTFSRSC